MVKIGVIAVVFLLVALGIFLVCKYYQLNQLKKMSFDEMAAYTTKNNDKAKITVGVFKDGSASYTVYGKNGEILPQKEYIYEIGSITKTFTGALVCKAVEDKKLDLDISIDNYIELPKKQYYPTVRRLVTHTSGYKSFYFEEPMVSNFFHKRNDFYAIDRDMLISRIGKINLENRDYSFCYSNFGMAVVGRVLEEIYRQDYTALVNNYIKEELVLKNTKVSDKSGNLEDYWEWKDNDAYIPAGALTSDISDMLKYSKMQIEQTPDYLNTGHKLQKNANASNAVYEAMGIHTDSIGVNWIFDNEHNMYWHNGGTDNYNSYMCFDLENDTAVVVLSNLKPNYRIPATIMGVKLFEEISEIN